MKMPNYDPKDLAADIVIKHYAHLNGEIIKDITTAIQEAYDDGYCRALSETPWYFMQDQDLKWLESFNEQVDEASDDLFTEEDLNFWDEMSEESLIALDKMLNVLEKDTNKDLPPGSPFDRGDCDE